MNNSSTYSTYFPTSSGGGGNALITLTFVEAAGLFAGGTIVPGQLYYITDATASGYRTIDLGVMVIGEPTGKRFSIEGSGGFLNADWQSVGSYSGVEDLTKQPVAGFPNNQGLWSAAAEGGYSNGYIVIWNNLHYQVIASESFSGADPATNNVAYALLPKNMEGMGYIEEWDKVEFDFINDWLQCREDSRGNRVKIGYIVASASFFWSGSNNPLVRYKWGSNVTVGNTVENAMCDIRNVNASYRFRTITPDISTFDAEIEFLTSGTMTIPAYAGVCHVVVTSPGDNVCNSFDTTPTFSRRFTVSAGADATLVFDNSSNIVLPSPSTSVTIAANDEDFIEFKANYLGTFLQTASEQY